MDNIREYRQEEIEQTWKWRCYQYCKAGNLSSLYYILRALHRGAREQRFPDMPDTIWPRFGNACKIDKDGNVLAKYQSHPQSPIVETKVGTVLQVRDAMRRMADNLKLSDADRTELFNCFSAWIEKDERATSEV